MGAMIALLQGINVGGHRKVPMAELRALAEENGLHAPRTYVASGNLVFESGEPAAKLESKLETAIASRFGFSVPVVVRTAVDWARTAAGNPFPEESAATPGLVLLVAGKQPADDHMVAALRAKAGANEKVERVGPDLWIWFGDGSGRSKLGTGPKKGVWTSRNWRTVQALRDMAGA
jgi:uncharacterized protein (DUF1697 family)